MDIEDAVIPYVHLGDGEVVLSGAYIDGAPTIVFSKIEAGRYSSGDDVPFDVETDPFLGIAFHNKASVEVLLKFSEALLRFYQKKEELDLLKDVQEKS